MFSGDEVELKITDRNNPSIIILASDPGTQDINSALYSSVLNRTLRLINSKTICQEVLLLMSFQRFTFIKLIMSLPQQEVTGLPLC